MAERMLWLAQESALALRRMLALFLACGMFLPAIAADGGLARPVGDPAVEARVNRLAEDLRCLTCMGQSIADSQSSFSTDMKREIRTMIGAGKSDKDIMDFMVQRYGDFVLYRPPMKATTLVLWAGPFVALLLALAVLAWRLVRAARPANPLSDEEQAMAALVTLIEDKFGEGE